MRKNILITVLLSLYCLFLYIKYDLFIHSDSLVVKVISILFTFAVTSATLLYLFYYKQLKYLQGLEKDKYSVSVVIPCYNEQDTIESTVRSIFNQKYSKNIETICVNDGSRDNTGKILDRLKIELGGRFVVIHKKNQGKRRAMYDGYLKAKNEVVVFIDSDTTLEANMIQNITQPLSDKRIGGVVGKVNIRHNKKTFIEKIQESYYARSFDFQRHAESAAGTVLCISGCAAAYRREVLEEVIDGWDRETFLGKEVGFGDDRALTNRVLLAGYKTVYREDALVTTTAPYNWKGFIKQQLRWKKGWFINSVLMAFKMPFVKPLQSFFVLLPSLLSGILIPFLVLWLLYTSLSRLVFPLVWLEIVAVLTLMMYTAYLIAYNDRKRVGVFNFIGSAAVIMVVLSTMLIPALLTIQNRKWATR